MIEEQSFIKQYQTKAEKIYFDFTTNTIKDEIEEELINQVLDICFNKLTTYKDLKKVVTLIKTIFKDYNEKTLNIIYRNKIDDTIIIIKYNNEELIDLTINKPLKYNNKDLLVVSGDNINILDTETQEKKNITTEIEIDIQYLIANLSNIKATSLTMEEEGILKAYKLLYEENPDFTKEETITKFQMIGILFYGYYKKYKEIKNGFSPITKNNLQTLESNRINTIIDRLTPFGAIDVKLEKKNLPGNTDKAFIAIRELIKDHVYDEEDELDVIIKFANAFYTHAIINYPDNKKDININYNKDLVNYIITKTEDAKEKSLTKHAKNRLDKKF